jgi:hypothetical protein
LVLWWKPLAALLEAECMDLRPRIEARAPHPLAGRSAAGPQANTYGPSRGRLSVAWVQVEVFNKAEATLVNRFAKLSPSD